MPYDMIFSWIMAVLIDLLFFWIMAFLIAVVGILELIDPTIDTTTKGK